MFSSCCCGCAAVGPCAGDDLVIDGDLEAWSVFCEDDALAVEDSASDGWEPAFCAEPSFCVCAVGVASADVEVCQSDDWDEHGQRDDAGDEDEASVEHPCPLVVGAGGRRGRGLVWASVVVLVEDMRIAAGRFGVPGWLAGWLACLLVLEVGFWCLFRRCV